MHGRLPMKRMIRHAVKTDMRLAQKEVTASQIFRPFPQAGMEKSAIFRISRTRAGPWAVY